MVQEASPGPDGDIDIELRSRPPARVLGVCGGSGAGKTFLVRQLHERTAAAGIALAHVSFDAYYHDLSHLSAAERSAVNFDHPDSLDSELFVAHLEALAAGEAVEVPCYDFATHTRTGRTERVGPADAVVVEGILLLTFAAVREVLDVAVYLDVPADLRLDRRMARDTVERGRDVADVERQWREFVEPMHATMVAPHAASADMVVGYGDDRDMLLDQLVDRLAPHGARRAGLLADPVDR